MRSCDLPNPRRSDCGRTEDLAILDLLTRPVPTPTKAQEAEVEKAARRLFETLQALRVEYRRQTHAAVQSETRVVPEGLPEEPCPQGMQDEKVEAVWQFVHAQGAGRPGAGAALH